MKKHLIILAFTTASILLIPYVAMRFTDEVNWTLFDFIFAGTLIFGTGLMYELVIRKMSHSTYRAAVGVALVAAFLLIWINGAVGIIGNEGNPINLMYLGVLAVGIIGAFITRLEPSGMARTLASMAVAQMLVPVIALIIATPQVTLEQPGVAGVFGLNAVFAMIFSVSALLFRHAGQRLELVPRT